MRLFGFEMAEKRRLSRLILTLAVCCSVTGCSIKRMALNQLGDALASGGSTFSSDNDPELVRDAIPFSLKLMESLLEENPGHEGLLLAVASGFTQYSYAFVQMDADMVEDEDFHQAETLRDRSRKLYLRGRNYGLRGLEMAHPGFEKALRANPTLAVKTLAPDDVPLIFWTASAWGAAIGISKNQPRLVGEQILVEALMDRALELDASYDMGAIHGFFIIYEMARQGGDGDPAERSRQHFEKAVELSQGRLAGPYVAYAESVMVQKQDVTQFRALMGKALAVDPDALPETRLVNLIMQDRARWLLSRLDELFLITEEPSATGSTKLLE